MVRKILSVVIPRFPDGTPIKNTHTLYSTKDKYIKKGDMIYPKPRITNHSQIEFVKKEKL